MQKCVACGVRDGGWVDGSARIAFPATALDSGPTPKRRAQRPARLGKEGARRPIDPLGDQTMATTSLANRSASVSSEPDATSDGHVGASLCWRYARISLVEPRRASSVQAWCDGASCSSQLRHSSCPDKAVGS